MTPKMETFLANMYYMIMLYRRSKSMNLYYTDASNIELIEDYFKVEAEMNRLMEKRSTLLANINSELPFEKPTGCYYTSKDGSEENLYFYHNFKNRSYYTGPIYTQGGNLAGISVSKKSLINQMNAFVETGFREVDSHGNAMK